MSMTLTTEEAKTKGQEPKFDHEFKSHPDVFWPAARGEKTFEYRRDDRGGYEVGQTVRLRCYDPDHGYHGNQPLDRRITNILRGGEFELPQGYCILSLAPLAAPRTDSAEGAAGTDRAWPASYQETFDAIAAATKIQAGMISVSVRDFYRALSYPDRSSTPTPPAPPGVPDSVRALSEAATQGEWAVHPFGFITPEGDNRMGVAIATGSGDPRKWPADRAFIITAVNRLREEISTHPAGQSAGSGAGLVVKGELSETERAALAWLLDAYERDECCTPDAVYSEHITPTEITLKVRLPESLRLSDDVARTSSRALECEVQRAIRVLLIQSGYTGLPSPASLIPEHPSDEEALRLIRDVAAYERSKPAPVSTRTGDEGPEGGARIKAERDEYAEALMKVAEVGGWQASAWLHNEVRAALAARPAAPEAQGAWRSRAADDVLAERRRQVEAEGWTPEHDDVHSRCEMASAAACYATASSPIRIQREWTYPDAPAHWPWCWSWWKPAFYRRNLVKAAALLIAEIERWDRLTAPPSSGQGGR